MEKQNSAVHPKSCVRTVRAVGGACCAAPSTGTVRADAIPRWEQSAGPNGLLINICGNESEQSEWTGVAGFTFDWLSAPVEAPGHKEREVCLTQLSAPC